MPKSRTWKAAILASGQAATALVGLVLAAVLSRVFDEKDYATYRQALLVYNLAAPLLALGLPAALYYFMPGEKNRARGILLENLLLLTSLGLLFTVFILCGGNVMLAERFSNPDLEYTLLLFAVYPVVALPATATTACLMARDRVGWVALHTIGTRLLRLVIVLLAVWLISPTPQIAITATVVAAFLTLGSGLWLMLRSTKGSLAGLTRPGMKEQLAYSIPMGLGAMIATLHRGLDKFIVSIFTLPENFAVYVNGATEIPLVGMVTGSATAVLLPELRQLLKDGKKTEALAIWKRAGIKAGVIVIPLMGVFLALAPDVMALVYSEKYRASHEIFRIYLLCLPIRIVIFAAVFQAVGRTDLILKRSALALGANLILSIIFSLSFGYKSVALATVAAIYLAAVPYSVWKVSQLLETTPWKIFPWSRVLLLLGVSLVGGLVALLTVHYFPWDHTLLRAGTAAAAYGLAMVGILPRLGLFRIDWSRKTPLKKRVIWTL